jgi:catechol 2,3-dioxygenase
MPVQSIGHAVLKVRDLERSEAFYHGVLGLPVATRAATIGQGMTFFTLGNHHDFAIMAMGADAPASDPKGVGLLHVAFKVGDTLDELRAMKQQIEAHGWKIDRAIDHGVTNSLYLRDPDGNGIELYADVSDSWKRDPSDVANVLQPLSV